MLLGSSCPTSCHFPHLQADCTLWGADSQVGGFVYVLGPCGPLQWTLLWDWEFLSLPQSPKIFTARSFEYLVSCTETLGFAVCLTPQLFSPACPHMNVGLSGQPASHWPLWFAIFSCHTSSLPLSLPFLPVWMNISLTPWLSDFHAVWFSGRSVFFFFSRNWLLSFFWLCKEAKLLYLCLHLGWWGSSLEFLILRISDCYFY